MCDVPWFQVDRAARFKVFYDCFAFQDVDEFIPRECNLKSAWLDGPHSAADALISGLTLDSARWYRSSAVFELHRWIGPLRPLTARNLPTLDVVCRSAHFASPPMKPRVDADRPRLLAGSAPASWTRRRTEPHSTCHTEPILCAPAAPCSRCGNRSACGFACF